MKEKFKSKYFKFGLAIFWAGVALIGFYSGISNLGDLGRILSRIEAILFPFILGLVIAYLLCPIYNVVVRKTYHFSKKGFKTGKGALRFARIIGSIVSLLILFSIIGGLMYMVIPELIKSLIGIVQELPYRINEFLSWFEGSVQNTKYAFIGDSIEGALRNVENYFVEWTKGDILNSLGMYLQRISQGVLVTLKTLLDFLVATIVAIYFLNGKESFRAQSKKLIMAILRKDQSDALMEFANFTNKTFGGFINGKLIDSLIIGILCFILMTIIGLPYPILISAIVGITNIIPFFGPFIGAIPSGIIILTISPMDTIYFAIMILALQQLDGNVIGPKILGGSIGLPSFWVMFSIIVGGGLFGFIGMVLGVPVFAVIYYYFSKFIDKKLIKKNMPTRTFDYQDYNKYDIDRKDVL